MGECGKGLGLNLLLNGDIQLNQQTISQAAAAPRLHDMRKNDPYWIAPRVRQDWKDDGLMLAVAWLKSFVPARDMERRIEQAQKNLIRARAEIHQGKSASYYDPADAVAWYVLQAETFATDQKYWTPEGVMRVVPYLTRIGKELPLLLTVKGVEERAARLMLAERRQPDSGLFELLVALAYRRNGWDRVEFVAETPGRGKTPDIHVYRPKKRWAVECKRLVPSPYAAREKLRGEILAQSVHELSLEMHSSIVVEISYKVELADVPDDYLIGHVRKAIITRSLVPWSDHYAVGCVRPVDWSLARAVLSHDDVYFGGSRMIELLVGEYRHDLDHSMSAKWKSAKDRPQYADALFHASIVSWRSLSREAISKKARHFKSLLSKAEGQLPSDRPSVIHIGVESSSGTQVDFSRHLSNMLEARFFKPRTSRLRWVYGNYFVPEATTHRDESWAITETMVPYKISSHRTEWPLPGHFLVSPEGAGRPGVHWDEEGYS